MGNPLFLPRIEAVNQPSKIYWEPTIRDLSAQSFSIGIKHNEKTVCVHAIVKNTGNVPINGPFRVAVGIEYINNNLNIYTERILHVSEEVIILPGENHKTEDCTIAALNYIDEDPLATYTFFMLVDVNFDVNETVETNNTMELEWYMFSPATAKLTKSYDMKQRNRRKETIKG